MQFYGDTKNQGTSGGEAGSELQSVRTARPLRRFGKCNVTGLFTSDISHRRIRPHVSKMVVEKYQADVKIYFQKGSKSSDRVGGGKREKIIQLTDKSVRNMQFCLRNVMHLMHSISTVTYPDDFPRFGGAIKRHIDILGKRLARKGVRYVWVMEFQERGAAHFHIFSTEPIDRQWLAKAWYEIVNSGDEKHFQAGTSIQYIVEDHDPCLEPDRIRYKALKAKRKRNVKRNFISRSEAISYVVAYYKKETQKGVPCTFYKPGRFWSASRGLLKCSKKIVKGDINELKRNFRIIRKCYKAQLRNLPKSIKWKPKSSRTRFILWDGMKFFNFLDSMQNPASILKLEDAVPEKREINHVGGLP